MDPLVIIEEGPETSTPWTHLINLELIAEHYGRTPDQLMAFLKCSLNSRCTFENRLYGSYSPMIIKCVLQVMAYLDMMGRLGLKI